jgi:hypothetical protein
LEYKDVSGSAVYDHNGKKLYVNGTVAFSGTLYIPYLATTPDIDLTVATAVWSTFPSRFLPLLGFYAIGLHMGGVDYDSVTARMAPANLETMRLLKNAMEKWDNELQLTDLEFNDPTDLYAYPRLGTINRNE